jgi:acyl carrier protein
MSKTPDELLEIVRTATVNILGVDAASVTLEADFAADFEADSLAMVEIITEVEDELGIEVPPEELKDVKTVGQAVELLQGKVA